MRVIAGELRGLRLATLPGDATRPTLERVKEGMFSAVHFELPGAEVADLCAGSGQLGIEALSRGAARGVFVDVGKNAVAVIRKNLATAGLPPERSRVVQAGVEGFLARSHEQFDLILLDPPYKSGLLPGLLERLAAVCRPGAAVLCETAAGLAMPAEQAGLHLEKQHRYGTVLVSRYRMQRPE